MVAPRAIVSIASVATKGGNENFVMTQPLKKPNNKPISTADKTPPKTVNPMNKSNDSIAIPFFSKPAQIAEVNAKIEPTERSIPAISTTNVMPTEMQTLTDICRSTFHKLLVVRNLSDKMLMTKHSKNNAMSDCDFLSKSLFIFRLRISIINLRWLLRPAMKP